MNGTYCIVVDAGTTGLSNFTDYACVCCLNLDRLCQHSETGSVWVDGQNIWFISGMCWENCIKNDGSDYGDVGIEHAGTMWVGSGDYLEYIDATGHHRRTHNGDPWGIDGHDRNSCCNVGAANAGFMWDRDNWAFLYFINCNGQMIRMGNGFIYGNGP